MPESAKCIGLWHEKAKIEQQKAQAKQQIQQKAIAEAIALKAQISSSIQDKQETGDSTSPSINLKESSTTTMNQSKLKKPSSFGNTR